MRPADARRVDRLVEDAGRRVGTWRTGEGGLVRGPCRGAATSMTMAPIIIPLPPVGRIFRSVENDYVVRAGARPVVRRAWLFRYRPMILTSCSTDWPVGRRPLAVRRRA
jgi:hypothetical protein